MKRKILFRVDAGGEVGLGHFYRSYNLALALKKNNFSVTFVHKKSSFWDNIQAFEFPHSQLDSNNTNKDMFDICLKENFKILYVDGIIDFLETDVKRLEGKTKIVFYQNISKSRHLSDVFILPSIHQDKRFFKKFDTLKTQIYQGLEFFTFNKNIINLSPKELDLKSNVNKIGIICGGSDPKNVMLSIFKLINFTKWENLVFSFYYGDNYMHKTSIPKEHARNVKFRSYDINSISKNDLLIAAFGVSTYEFMALGMPIISVGHQETNTNASKILEEKTKAIYHLGLIDSVTEELLNETIDTFVTDLTINKKLSDTSKEILDLKGVDRIVRIIENI